MEKKYQVFISSTYQDLVDVRNSIATILLEQNCIPIGMEWFPALDEEQFYYIMQIIDNSDYVVLIIGTKYGTIAPNGKSFTENEYNYAIKKKKKIIALLQKDVVCDEQSDSIKSKYYNFVANVKKGKLIREWQTPADIAGVLSSSLSTTIKKFPAPGLISCLPQNCEERLPLMSLNKAVASINLFIKSLHVMCSTSSTFIPLVKEILKTNRHSKEVFLHVYIRAGINNNEARQNDMEKQADLWRRLKIKYAFANIAFYYVSDFDVSFRGIVLNEKIGLIGFYNRINGNTIGSDDDIIIANTKTDSGKYLIKSFLRSFKNKKSFNSFAECFDDISSMEGE